ncbi:hypothetical protein GYB22_02005 [bacterium]|nr:hypothetical protein [bacterium]
MPKEEPITPFPRGDVSITELDMGTEKSDIVFFDLESNSIIDRAHPLDWDFYFDNGLVKINFLRSLKVAEVADLDAVSDTVGLEFRTLQRVENRPMWSLEIGKNYVVDLGMVPETGAHLGFIKLKLVSDQEIEWSDLNTNNYTSKTITTGMHYYNLRKDSFVELPLETDYDLVFGKYSHFFEVEQIDYEVLGTLTGSATSTRTTLDFSQITAETADTLDWDVYDRDAIGYDWKSYNIDKGAYEILTKYNYMVRTESGFLYKLRFTGFYNDNGISGHPTFEVKLL